MTNNTQIPRLVRWRNALLMSGERGPKLHIRTTLLTLSVRANTDSLEFFMPVSELADWLGVSKRTAERHLRDALDSGWITQLRRGHSGGNASVYRLTVGDTVNPSGDLTKKRPAPTADTYVGTDTDDGGLPTDTSVDYRHLRRGSTDTGVGPTVITDTTVKTGTVRFPVMTDEPDF